MSTLTATQLQQQYIAYFGRPGDPAGIKYWLSSTSGISSAREFADKIYAQDEYKTSTVGSKSTEAQVNSLYQNLFGREADASGLIYWTGQIEKGILTLSNIAFDLIAAASNPVAGNESQGTIDAQILSNKVAAAEAFTADVEASTSAILAYQPETTTPWKTGSAFESGVTYLSGITTTAHTDTAIDSAVTSMIAANTSAGSTTAGTTYKFTSTTDALVGGAGDDKFNGVLQLTDGAAVTGTTIAPGDDVEGKGGTDTVAIAVAGAQNTPFTLSAVATNEVEKVTLSNFETSANLTTVDASLMNGLTTVGLSSSSATGDSAFSGVKNLVDAEMRNGSADLTVTYSSSVLSGESDTQNLTVSNLSGGTFTANGAETIVIKSETSKSKLTNVTGTGNTALTISGDKGLTISSSLTQKTIDASASTGGVSLNIGSATSTVTGGSGDDEIQFKLISDITKDDTIKGGAGTDTLKLAAGSAVLDGESDTAGQELYGVSGFEIIDINATHDDAEVELDTLGAGIKTLKAAANTAVWTPAGDNSSDASQVVSFTLNGVAYTTAALDLTGDAAADLPILTAGITTAVNAVSGWEAVDNSTTVTVTNTGTEEIQLAATAVSLSHGHTFGTTFNVAFSDAAADQALDIYSGAIVKLRLKDASGDSDVANVNLKSVSGDKALDTTIEDLDIANTETLNISTSGKASTAKYTVSDISADASLTSLKITGSNDLVVSDTATGNTKLVTVDASSFTGDLTISTMTASAKQTVTTGSGNDNVDFGANLTEDDVVDLGGNSTTSGGWQATTGKTGKDKLETTGALGSTATDDAVLQVKNVEVFENVNSGAVATYIDASKMSNIGVMRFDGTSGTVKIKNLAAGIDIGLGVGAAELFGTLDVALADATGTADSLGLVVPDTVTGHTGSLTLKTTGIETINITATAEAAAAQAYTITTADVDASKIVLTGGTTANADTYDLATLNKTITNIDASALDGLLIIDGIATDVATTISHKGTEVVTADLSGGNDTISLGTIGITIHNIDTSTGTDTLSATLDNAASDFTNIDGVETFNLTIKDETATGFNHATKINGLNEATTVNILGGNALSTFTIATGDIHDDSIGATDNIEVVDASTFGGTFDVLLDTTAFDDTLTIKGPTASTSDVIRFAASATDSKIKSMTGIETLALFTADADVDAVVDLTNATGVKKITLAYTSNTNDDAVEFKKVEAGTTFEITTTQHLDKVTIGMADASTTTTALSVDFIDFENGVDDTFDLDAAGVETLTINDKSADVGETLDLAGVTATTGSKTKLVLQGGDLTLANLSSSFNVVDASTATGAITLSAANRPNTQMTITGGLGDDALVMEHKDDVIDGGLGTDTLTLTGNAVLGGYAVDLTSSTDQVPTFAGAVNAPVQKGFENLDASAITGSWGAEITATSKDNNIKGTNQVDNITAGLGADDITPNGGNDFIDITETTQSIDKVRMITALSNGTDTITGFSIAGGDVIQLPLGDTKQDTTDVGSSDVYQVGAGSGILGAHVGVYVNNANNLAGLSTAQIDSNAGTLTTVALDSFFYVSSDGTDTHIFEVAIAGTSFGQAAGDVYTHIGTLKGISDAATLTKTQFIHDVSGTDTFYL